MKVETGEAVRVRPPDDAGRDPPSIGLPRWEQLYEELGGRVFRVLLRLTGDAELAEDLTHDTFVRVYARADQYAGSGSANGWVFRIATNLARDALRRRRIRAVVETVIGRERPLHLRADQPEIRIALQRAIAGLPATQRAILLLHDVDGHTHEEIAAMLGLAPGSSKAALSRARARMRRQMSVREARHD